MEPSEYLPIYLERAYLISHPDLTPAARELVHDDVRKRPEKYALDDHARALISYEQTRAKLLRDEVRLEDEPSDEAFETDRNRLFDEARELFARIGDADRLCIDARLLVILLADTPVDTCLGEAMELERETRDYLLSRGEGFSLDTKEAPHFWNYRVLDDEHTAEDLTRSNPIMIGWLHTLEVIAQLCITSARYRAAERYAREVMRAVGYPNQAAGTVFLALARLEDEDAFFKLAHELEEQEQRTGSAASSQTIGEANGTEAAGPLLEYSPWYLLGRTLLLYKKGKKKPSARALREFATRCDGGAFFLLNPTYLTPYMPVRPPLKHSWSAAHQAVWEADGILIDTPDFASWVQSVDGISDIADAFADRNGF